MKTVLITGGTGLVGKAISKALLAKGYAVIILSREKRDSTEPNLSYALWDVAKQTIDHDAVTKADFIIHLAGASLAEKRWTEKRKKEIVDSRVESSRLLIEALALTHNNVKAVVSASAIGWYGPDRGKEFTEKDPAFNDFLGKTCEKWEASIEPVIGFRKRLVKLRIGIVLSEDGGALKEFEKPLKFGVAAVLGSGRQIVSWIHLDDLVNMFIAAIENEQMQGSFNAVAPNPVSNKELTLTLARSRKKSFMTICVPAFLLRLVLGGLSIEVLKSATVSANKIINTGFTFKFPLINQALKS